MRKELDEQLCKEFPELYINRNGDMRYTCMVWGFDHGDGWFSIIHNLSGVADNLIKNFNDDLERKFRESKGLKYDYKLTEEEKQNIGFGKLQIVADQVKEKYGTLRFYWHTYIKDGFKYPDELKESIEEVYNKFDGAEAMACRMSHDMCEECGASGSIRGPGWYRTLCDKHALEQGYSLDEDEEETSDVGGES